MDEAAKSSSSRASLVGRDAPVGMSEVPPAPLLAAPLAARLGGWGAARIDCLGGSVAEHGCFPAPFGCFGAGCSWDLLRRGAASAAVLAASRRWATCCGEVLRARLPSRAVGKIGWLAEVEAAGAPCCVPLRTVRRFRPAGGILCHGLCEAWLRRSLSSLSVNTPHTERTIHATAAGRCNGCSNQLAHATWHLSSVIPGRPDAVCARIKRSSINAPVAAWDFDDIPRCDWGVYRRAQLALCKPFSGRVPSHSERTRCMGAFPDDAEASGDHGNVKHLKKWRSPRCAKTCFITVSPDGRNGRTTAC